MVSVEEKLLVNVLYLEECEALQGIDISIVNFENLMKLASNHLILPALFFNIKKKNLSHLFPEDFIECIKNIYSINKARNKILLKEAKELSELLYKDNINHIFLKGTALLLSNVFEDIGERMMCDIDFIIQHKDEEKIKKVLQKNKYASKDSNHSFRIFKPTHLPRMVNKNKTIGIEPHLELLEPKYRWFFNSKKLINDFKDVTKTIKTPAKSFLFDHCIYAIHIRDQGIIKSYHSHRSIYDIYKLDCKHSLTINNIKKNIFIKHFFITINKFKIFDIQIVPDLSSYYFEKLFRFSDPLLSLVFKIITKWLMIIQLITNNDFRKYALNKLINLYQSKTLLNYIYRWLKA